MIVLQFLATVALVALLLAVATLIGCILDGGLWDFWPTYLMLLKVVGMILAALAMGGLIVWGFGMAAQFIWAF